VQKAVLSTVDNTTPGLTRELYNIREFVGGLENNATPPAHVMVMPFELNSTIADTDRFIDIGIVKFGCDMTFMQRRMQDLPASNPSQLTCFAQRLFSRELDKFKPPQNKEDHR